MLRLPLSARFAEFVSAMSVGETRRVSRGSLSLRYCNPFDGVFLTLAETQSRAGDRVTIPGPGMVTLMFALRGDVTMRGVGGDHWEIPANTVAIMYRRRDELYEVFTPRTQGLLLVSLHLGLDTLQREPFKRGCERFCEGVFDLVQEGARLIATVGTTPKVRALVLQAAEACRAPERGRPLHASIKVLELLDGLGAMADESVDLSPVAPSKGDLDRLIRAKQFIEGRFAEPLTLTSLARELSISESKLTHAFREAFGVSPMTHLQEVRIAHAKAMLRTTDATIGQIAWAVGYRHQCNFAVAFKRSTGSSPKVYRAR